MRNQDRESALVPPGRYYLKTFGCQMNRHDSELVSGLLESRGWRREDDPAAADLILLNTCSVRRRPEEKVWGRLARYRNWKRRRPDLVLGVLGCMARLRAGEIRRRFPEVGIVLGPENLHLLGGMAGGAVSLPEEAEGGDSSAAPAVRESPVSAWVTVSRGCDNYCSYCVVPYARGRQISRPPGEILAEVRGLGARGYREVTLLGQNVNSYRGVDPGGEPLEFAGLLRLLDPVGGITRIRFVTSHPRDISPDLVGAVAGLEKVCEFLHFPAQSGSDAVLQRMGRGYTRDDYLSRVRRLREAVGGIALASDFIVGFPGETGEDFDRTLDLVEAVGFDQIFAFAYSPRPGTAAAEMEDDVSAGAKSARLEKLLTLQKRMAGDKNRKLVGKVFQVLVEGKNRKYPRRGEGRTRTGKMVFFPWAEGLTGRLVPVRIERTTDLSLYGTIVSPETEDK